MWVRRSSELKAGDRRRSLAVAFSATVLWASAALFLVFGLVFLVAPSPFYLLITGSVPDTSAQVVDMRAIHGGTAVGVGLFFGVCAYRRMLRIGLLAALLVLGSVSIARLAGVFLDGPSNWITYLQLLGEWIFLGFLALAWKRTEWDKPSDPND